MSLNTSIDALKDEQVFEVARKVLPSLVGILEPGEAPERTVEILGVASDHAVALQREVDAAATSDVEDAASCLRIALKLASQEIGEDTLREAIADTGTRMTVVGPDLIALGVFVLLGYFALASKGRAKVDQQTVVERSKDGKIKVSVKTSTTYINPLTPLGALLGKLLPR